MQARTVSFDRRLLEAMSPTFAGVDEERDPAAEMDATDADDHHDLEVDPTDLSDDHPEVDGRPEADVGDRTDVRNRDRDADR